MSVTTEKVTTYADGFGRWYARIDLEPGFGPQEMSGQADRLRAKARRAIKREVMAREPWWTPPTITRVEVAEDLHRHGLAPDHMNVWRAITYREVA